MKIIVAVFVLAMSLWVQALEVDEKLTLRIVKTSESKKTILINRGVEDGLAKGDHAKFFVSEGVVARGVIIKASPTRSVWSIYRLVNSSYLQGDQVMKLKITPAVKITKDESRMLVQDDTVTSITARDPRNLGIPLAEGADDLDKVENVKTKAMSKSDMAIWGSSSSVDLLSRNKEVYGMIDFSSMSETTSSSTNTGKHSQSVTNLNFLLGGEWYFKDESSWMSRISFTGHFKIDRRAVMSHQGEFVRTESSEFGGGANLYLGARPSNIHRLIPYLNFTLALGSVKSTYDPGNANTSTDNSTSSAASILYNFGFGYKYYTSEGFGARFILSYVLRADQYAEDSGTSASWQNNRTGPAFNFGLSYRF